MWFQTAGFALVSIALIALDLHNKYRVPPLLSDARIPAWYSEQNTSQHAFVPIQEMEGVSLSKQMKAASASRKEAEKWISTRTGYVKSWPMQGRISHISKELAT